MRILSLARWQLNQDEDPQDRFQCSFCGGCHFASFGNGGLHLSGAAPGSDRYGLPYAYSIPHPDAGADRHSLPYAYSIPHPDAGADRHALPYAYPISHLDTGSDRHALPYAYPISYLDTGSDRHPCSQALLGI